MRYDSGFEERSPYGDRPDLDQQRYGIMDRSKAAPPVGHHNNYADIDYSRKHPADKVYSSGYCCLTVRHAYI